MKKGFTLIEILIALVIMAVLVGTAVLSVASGLKSARLRDAARVVAYYTRHAKAVALLKQKPVVITFEEIVDAGEFLKSRVSIDFAADAQDTSSNMGSAQGGGTDGQARTLSGALVSELEGGGDVLSKDDEEGDDPLAAAPKEFEGIHVQAELRDEEQERRPRISVFSNVDALRRQSALTREKKSDELEMEQSRSDDDSTEKTEDEIDEETSLSVVYEANGRCTPYRITVWKDGAEKEDGIVINIGQFGRPVTEP